MGVNFGIFKVEVPTPITIDPGESKILVDLSSFSADAGFHVIAMGVTEHPNADYTYSIDGRGFTLPVPLGTFITPLYTCRDLGSYIEVQERLQIAVRNNDREAHRYAVYILYNSYR